MGEIDIVEAIRRDDYMGIKKAIKAGADLEQIVENELNENEESLLFYALHHKCDFETIKLLTVVACLSNIFIYIIMSQKLRLNLKGMFIKTKRNTFRKIYNK